MNFIRIFLACFSWKLTKKVLEKKYRIFTTVYFSQGLLFGLTAFAFPLYLQKQFNLNMCELAAMDALMHLPWFIKPFWGLISDRIIIFGRRRLPYIIICSLIVFISSLVIANAVVSYWPFIIAAFFLNLGFGFVDVACDAHGVDKCKNDPGEEGTIQAVMWEARCLGTFFVGIVGGQLLNFFGERFIFNFMAIFPLIPGIMTLFSINEEQQVVSAFAGRDVCAWRRKLLSRGIIAELFNSCPWRDLLKFDSYRRAARFCAVKLSCVKYLIIAGIFLFIFNFIPYSSGAMQYFLGQILGYSDFQRGLLGSMGAFGGFLGLRYFRKFISNADEDIDLDIRRVFKWTIVSGAIIGLLYIAAVYCYFSLIALTIIGSFISFIGFVSSMRVAVRSCPTGIEGTIFAAMMSLCNIGGMVGGLAGGKIFDYFGRVAAENIKDVVYQYPRYGFTLMALIGTIMGLAPLLILPLLKNWNDEKRLI